MKFAIRLLQLAVLFALLAALAVWLWIVFFPTPEKIIRHRLHGLATDVSFGKNDGDLSKLTGLAEAANVSEFFATNVAVNIDLPGQEQHTFVGRDEITQAALAARRALSALSVKFPDINVTLAPDKQSAVADATVEVHASDEADTFDQELKITFTKTDRQWLISQVDTVRTITRPVLKQ